MRLALIVDRRAAESSGPRPAIAALATRLGAADAGFDVRPVAAGVDLPARITDALDAAHVGPDDTVLLAFVGPAVLDADRELALVAAGSAAAPEGTWGVREVRDRLVRRAPRHALVLLDLLHAGAAGDAMAAFDQVDAAARAIATATSGVALLVASRSHAASGADDASPLVDLLLAATDDPSCRDADTGAVRLSTAYERMRESPRMFAEIACCAFRPARRDVELVRPPEAPIDQPAPPQVVELERSLERGDQAMEAKDHALALAEYKKALMLLEERSARRAEVYYRIGRMKLADGKEREAVFNFDKALDIAPSHRGAIDALVDYYAEREDWWRMIAVRRRSLAGATDPNERYGILLQIGRAWLLSAKDPRRAAEAFEEAVAIRPDEPPLLRKLVELYEELRDDAKLLATVERLVAIEPDAALRAKDHVVMGDLARMRLGDPARALGYYEKALALDPTLVAALEAISVVEIERGAFAPLAGRFADHAAKLEESAPRLAGELWGKVARLRRDRLDDRTGAVEAFRRSIRLRPGELAPHVELAMLLEREGDLDGAVGSLELAARIAPRSEDAYRELHRLLAKLGRVDRAYHAAAALEELGRADLDEQLYCDQYRPPPAPIRPRAALDPRAWREALSDPEADPHVTAILEAVGPAAIAVRYAQLDANGALPELDPAGRQDVATSTVTFLRSLAWASSLLGVAPPVVYLRDEVPGGVAVAPSREPTLIVARSMLSGHDMAELAFVAGRHLVYFWPAHHPLVLYPSLADVSVLFLAALRVVVPELPVAPELTKQVAALRRALADALDAPAKQRLEEAVRRFDDAGGRVDLRSHLRSIERAANRAGFVLAGGLAPAKKMIVRDDRPVGDLSPADRVADLLAWSVSERCASLRAALGVAIADDERRAAPDEGGIEIDVDLG